MMYKTMTEFVSGCPIQMKQFFFLVLAAIIPLTVVPNAFATVVDYDDETQQEEECKEQNDYPFLCSGNNGVNGLPFCDKYNVTERAEQFPNITKGSCFDRTTDPITFCAEFDDLTNSYEDCRQVPGTEEYIEYMATGGPDQSCLFDITQIKCLPFPGEDKCPVGFGNNEDDRCVPRTLINGEWKWVCPEGYHNVDEGESGQCYSNGEECQDTMIFEGANKSEGDLSDSCVEYKIDCDLNEGHPLCNGEERTDGVGVCDEPDHPGYKFCKDD
jgi:hypothetical protein